MANLVSGRVFLIASLLTVFCPSRCLFADDQSPKAPGKEKVLRPVDWKPGLYEAELKKGKLVWLTFTADWCLVCKVNEARVFSDRQVLERLDELGVVVIRADFTERTPEMREALKDVGGKDVPTNVIAGSKGKQRIILPEVLDSKTVLRVLKEFEKGDE